MTSTGFTVLKYSYLILLPLLFAVFVRTFFFDIYFVPSSSMERTLFPNDYVLVNKVSYGTKIPKRVNDIPLIGNVIKSENKKFEYNLFKPLKGYLSFAKNDIIVLKAPDNNTKFYIKRIIGNPGENFEILAGEVSINHDKLIKKEQYVYKYFTQKNKDSLFFLSVEEYNNLKKNDIIKYVENDCKKRQDNTTLGGKK